MFLQVRDNGGSTLRRRLCATSLPGSMRRTCVCSPPIIAGADGLFIAKEVGGDSVDLIKLFDLHTRVVWNRPSDCCSRGEEA